jgi:hypothetical protein
MLATEVGSVKIMAEYGNKILQNGLKPLFTMKFSEEKQEEFCAHIPVTWFQCFPLRKNYILSI